MQKNISTKFDVLRTVDMADIMIPMIKSVFIMVEEKKIPLSMIDHNMKEQEVLIIDSLLSSQPRWTLHPYFTIPKNKEKYVHKYIYWDSKGEYVRWNQIHGKHRKIARFECKKERKRISEMILAFNHFAGRNDVICIRVESRDFKKKEEYISKIKTSESFLQINPNYNSKLFDSTIQDIYLKVDPEIVHAYLQNQAGD